MIPALICNIDMSQSPLVAVVVMVAVVVVDGDGGSSVIHGVASRTKIKKGVVHVACRHARG